MSISLSLSALKKSCNLRQPSPLSSCRCQCSLFLIHSFLREANFPAMPPFRVNCVRGTERNGRVRHFPCSLVIARRLQRLLGWERDLVALISFSRAAKCAAPNASQPESARKMSRVSRGVDILRHGIDISADMVRAKCFPEAALMLLL